MTSVTFAVVWATHLKGVELALAKFEYVTRSIGSDVTKYIGRIRDNII